MTAFAAQWAAIGAEYHRRMWGASLRCGKYLREYAGSMP